LDKVEYELRFSLFPGVARDLNDPSEKGWRKVFERVGLRPIGA
jgi:hypothetical protein